MSGWQIALAIFVGLVTLTAIAVCVVVCSVDVDDD